MKKMATMLILLGLAVVIIGVAIAVNSLGEDHAPESGDLRILQTKDGHYQIQTYRSYPDWVDLGSSLETAAEAKYVLDHMNYAEKPRKEIVITK